MTYPVPQGSSAEPLPTPLEPVFATTFLYSACKMVGPDAWPAFLAAQTKHPERPGVWPSIYTLAGELPHVCDGEVKYDASTYIDRARCVAAGHFLASAFDVWLTCDDDIRADEDVLRSLILACRATRGGVAVPYINRDGRSMTFRKVSGPTQWIDLGGELRAPLRVVDRVGFGLVALHRELVEQLAFSPATKWFRESGTSRLQCPQLFVNDVEDGTFMGEDYYFSKLCADLGRPLRVLLNAPIEHAEILAMLDEEGHIRVSDPARAAVLDEALRSHERAVAGQQTERDGG